MPKGISREKSNKPRRVPVGGIRDIMTVYGKDPAFKYYWVKDAHEDGSRIARFKRGGYEFVRQENDRDEYVIGEEAVYKSKHNGSIIRLPTGNGEYSYLMRISMEFHLEDKAAKAEALLELEDQITGQGSSQGREPNDEGVYGNVKFT